MKRVGLGVVVALACAVGCNSFTADPPASTSDAGADAAADGPPPVVGGNPVPDDCANAQVSYDWESPPPPSLTIAGTPVVQTEASAHHAFGRFTSGSTPTIEYVAFAREACIRFAFRVTAFYVPESLQPGSTWTWGSLSFEDSAGMTVLASIGRSSSSFGSIISSGGQIRIGPQVVSDAGPINTWHVASFLFKSVAGRAEMTAGFDGVIVGTTTAEASPEVTFRTLFGSRANWPGAASVDIDDIRIRTTR